MRRKRKPGAISFFNMAMLSLESQQVIWLRMIKLATGGPKARTEANQMISEKMEAAAVASRRLMMGASSDSIISGYRKKVRANARRLSK
jgi:hypothetical protein